MRIGLPRLASVLTICLAATLVPTTLALTEQAGAATTTTPPMSEHYLSRTGSDALNLTLGPTTARITAPTSNTDTNDRVIMWRPATAMAVNEQVCATWAASQGTNVQEGLAFRVRHDTNGRWRTITVMKNIWYGAVWQFNVLVWDNFGSPTMKPIDAVSLEDEFYPNHQVAPLPWRVCAKVVGLQVTLKAWRVGHEAEPPWGDTKHGGTVTLPSGWDYAGKTGWYSGHEPPGGYSQTTDLTASNLPG